MKRSEARESAFFLLFEMTFRDKDRDAVWEAAASYAEIPTNGFTQKLYNGVLDHQDELDEIVETYCKNRKKERLSRVLLTAMRIALYEIRYVDDVPASVAINEAVNLTKKYDMPEMASYLNGVLGSYVRAEALSGN